MPQCWNVMECSLEHRVKCGAYPLRGANCWTIDDRQCSKSHSYTDEIPDCSECAFFQIMVARKRRGEKHVAY